MHERQTETGSVKSGMTIRLIKKQSGMALRERNGWGRQVQQAIINAPGVNEFRKKLLERTEKKMPESKQLKRKTTCRSSNKLGVF